MFINEHDFAKARTNLDKPPWSGYYQALSKLANLLLEAAPPRIDEHTLGHILIQARLFSRRVVSLSGYFRLTDDIRYAQKAWDFIEDALTWPQWYVTNPHSNGFNLATGEIAVSLALTLTFLEDWLSPHKRQTLVSQIKTRIIQPYLQMCAPPTPDIAPVNWYRRTNNWNAVCNGGMLVLALTLADEDEQAAKAIPVALKGLQYLIDTLHHDGSSKEGIGYWQYGTSYLAYALLSYEKKTDQTHPILASEALTTGLHFPFDFSPNGIGLSFGDGNRLTSNLGALLPLAQRVNQPKIIAEVNNRFLQSKAFIHPSPSDEHGRFTELLGVLFTSPVDIAARPKPAFQIYKDNGWALFRRNDITLSFRSGNTDVPHAHRDLNSIQVARGDVRLLENLGNMPYTAGWFSPGEHYFEKHTVSKNSMLINGVGQLTRTNANWGHEAGKMWSDAANAYFDFVTVVRREVSIQPQAIQIEDFFETTETAWHEIRFISFGEFTEHQEGRWTISRNNTQLHLSIKADRPLHFVSCNAVPSIGVKSMANLLRVISKEAGQKIKITTLVS
ncbi:MAG: heparinase II/III family protein [Chloroflexota bacterium]